MSRLLMLGVGPLPLEETQEFQASSSRVWHFAQPLLEDGHELLIISMALHRKDDHSPEPPADPLRHPKHGFEYVMADELGRYEDDGYMHGLRERFRPDGILGINAQHAHRACQIAADVPVWCDINGYHMGEGQLFSEAWGVDWGVESYWHKYRYALLRGDVFSTASTPQKAVLVGELGTQGRLNRHTAGYEFIHPVPNGRDPVCVIPERRVLRGDAVGEEDFVIYWSGGYNTWCDVETLFAGMEKAMAEDPSIRYLSTGGEIGGVDRLSYSRFQTLVKESKFRDRFLLVGWVPSSVLPAYYAEADAGINVDRDCYESLYGARNRITDMLKYSLPVITTAGTEISRVAGEEGCAWTCPIGDPDALAATILAAARDRQQARAMRARCREVFLERYTSEVTTRPVREWAKAPWHAPDYGEVNLLFPAEARESWWRRMVRKVRG